MVASIIAAVVVYLIGYVIAFRKCYKDCIRFVHELHKGENLPDAHKLAHVLALFWPIIFTVFCFVTFYTICKTVYMGRYEEQKQEPVMGARATFTDDGDLKIRPTLVERGRHEWN